MLKKRTRNENKNKETINMKHHEGIRPRPGAIFLPTHSITKAHAPVTKIIERVANIEPGSTIFVENLYEMVLPGILEMEQTNLELNCPACNLPGGQKSEMRMRDPQRPWVRWL